MEHPSKVIIAWLVSNCPSEAAELRAPAAQEAIAAAEQRLGVPLPADLVAWWRAADGMAGRGSLLPPMFTPYSVEEALLSRRSWLDRSERSSLRESVDPDALDAQVAMPAGTKCYGIWPPLWLPIAADGGGGDLFIDLRPGPATGCLGWFDHEEWLFERASWPSLGVLLARVAESMTTGTPINGRIPKAVDGRLEWWDEE
ncbi:SMI1/KNR4 family protein [Actinoplanes xinjiangensis]|uniref:SMI1/KNR4 family protein n=1 Tax=Actinoplanes xinjiangensis TaxID=512350 RepID=UPI00342DDCEB